MRFILCLFYSCFAFAFGTQNNPQPDLVNLTPVHLQSVLINGEVATKTGPVLEAGKTVEIKVLLNIDVGFHAYVEQYQLELADPGPYHLSEIRVQPTVEFIDPITKKKKIGTENSAEVIALLDLPNNISMGSHKVPMILTYQACTSEFCLLPKKIQFEVNYQVGAKAPDVLTSAMERGWLYTLFFVFLAGILTSFTPCIFPMIPITLAVLGTKDHGRTRLQGFSISLSYVLGIAITYAILGVAAAKTGALFGSLLGHPMVVAAIAVLFVAMGLSMYGLFEIKLPDSVANKVSSRKTQKGYIGAFGSGLIAGVVASPCVGPVLISILAYVAQTQNTYIGFILLFTYAIGLGQLFLVLGTFNHFIQKLPKSGPWLEQIKFIFGSIMIGMALYYVYPVAHSALFDGLIATSLIVVAIIFGVFRQNMRLSVGGHRIQRAFLISLLVLGLVFAIKSLVPEHMRSKFLFGQSTAGEVAQFAKPDWYKYSDELLAKARADKIPVIIDFKAEWCLACKELEMYTFSDPKVMELGKKFLWLEFDATSPTEELLRLQKIYNIGGLPYVAIYDSSGELRNDLTLTGFERAEHFIKRMEQALNAR